MATVILSLKGLIRQPFGFAGASALRLGECRPSARLRCAFFVYFLVCIVHKHGYITILPDQLSVLPSCGWMKRKYLAYLMSPHLLSRKDPKKPKSDRYHRHSKTYLQLSTSGIPLTRPRSKPVNRHTAQSFQPILTIYYSSASGFGFYSYQS